jgi:hypothetical protein
MIEHLFTDLQVYYNTGPAATQVRPFLEGPPKERPGSKCPLALNPAGLTAFLLRSPKAAPPVRESEGVFDDAPQGNPAVTARMGWGHAG